MSKNWIIYTGNNRFLDNIRILTPVVRQICSEIDAIQSNFALLGLA
jgi:hypothetical protein